MMEHLAYLYGAVDVQPQIEVAPETRITVDSIDEEYGRFVAQPLPSGWGITLGNSLRRVLLRNLPGTAIIGARIQGVPHEYATLPRMREDILEFLINLRGIRIRSNVQRSGRLRIELDGEGEVRAGDVMSSSDYSIVNPEFHLATLVSRDARLSVEMQVDHGTGYREAEIAGMPVGVLPVDAVFTPVRKSAFQVKPFKSGGRGDLESLELEVWTDRTVSPEEALRAAAQRLVDRYHAFVTFGPDESEEAEPNPHDLTPEQFNRLIDTLNLSERVKNSLKRQDMRRLGDVVARTPKELMQIRNFGRTSLNELYDSLLAEGLIRFDPRGEQDAAKSADIVAQSLAD